MPTESSRVAAAQAAARARRAKPSARLLSKAEVVERVGLTYPTIWKWMRGGKFPRARELGGKIAWLESDVERWINGLPVTKLKGDGA